MTCTRCHFRKTERGSPTRSSFANHDAHGATCGVVTLIGRAAAHRAALREQLRAAPTAQQGFTLMELLIAIIVSAVVLTAINGVFFGAMRLRNRTAENLDRSLPVQNALAAIRRDLMGIQLPGGTFGGTLNSNATINGETETETGPEIYTNTGTLTDYFPWGDIQRVAYVLRAPTNRLGSAEGRDLVRVVNRNPLPPVQDEPTEQRLLSDVELLEFGFYDGQNWRTTWNSSNETTTLPRAIRVTLTMSPPRTKNEKMAPLNRQRPLHQLVVPILLGPVTNSVATTDTSGGDE